MTSELDIVLVIKGWQGGDERQKIRERTTRGKTAKAKAGKVVGLGTPPYGYAYADDELFINESQAHTVRMIFDWYVNGDENNNMMSLMGITKRLTDMRIPTPSEAKDLNNKCVKDGIWNVSTVSYLLSSETYCGVLRYGKFIGSNGNGGRRGEAEHIIIPVPALVTREVWELAQARRKYNSRIAKRRTRREYLLRSLIYCGCERRMVGTQGHYYYCPGRYNMEGREVCKEPLVHSRPIESLTWNYIMDLIRSPEQFERRLRQAQAQEMVTMQPRQRELEHVVALLEDTEKEADAIARASTKARGIIAKKLEQQADEVDRRYEALTARKTELEETLTFELTDSTINDFLQFREMVAAGLQDPTYEDKRHWLEILQVTVTVSNHIAVVSFRLGGEPMHYRLTEYNIRKSFE